MGWIRTGLNRMLGCAVLLLAAACAGQGQNPPVEGGAGVAQSTPITTAATGSTSAVPAPDGGAQSQQYTPSTEDYLIGPQDLLELQVFGVEALNRTTRVNSRGFISLPLIGMTKAAGLTAEQLEEALAAKLAKDYLQNPQVSVFIKEFTSQRVTVEGAVKVPGVYPIKGRTSLLQALATAAGLTNLADPTIRVFRVDPATGNRTVLEFDLEKIRNGELRDPEVRNDDIVQVQESQGKSIAKELIEFVLPFRLLRPY